MTPLLTNALRSALRRLSRVFEFCLRSPYAQRVRLSKRGTRPLGIGVFLVLVAALQVDGSDEFDIITIGDSLTRGSTIEPLRASYRPYLWQTIDNFLGAPRNNPNGITVDFVGTEGHAFATEVTPKGDQTPIEIDPAWDRHHQGFGGASSLSFSRHYEGPSNARVPNQRFIGNVLDTLNQAGDTPEVALIFLGPDDLPILYDGDGFNRGNPMDAVTSIQTIVEILHNGYDGEWGSQTDPHLTVEGNPSMEVLITALPPVDERQRYDGDVPNLFPPVNTFLWTENDRRQLFGKTQDFIRETSPMSGVYVNGGGDGALTYTDSNDLIGVMNELLEDFADSTPKVTFVDPLDQTKDAFLVGADGVTDVLVDNGGRFDLSTEGGAFDSEGVSQNPNTDLSDGLHLNFTGDQYYAAHLWHGGLKALISQASGAAVFGRDASNFGDAVHTPVLPLHPSDCDADGRVEKADLRCVSNVEQLDLLRRALDVPLGDLDGDGEVAFSDFLTISTNFGRSLSSYADGNVDLQGGVGFADFLILAHNFGSIKGHETEAVPEPTACVLPCLALLALAARRRRLA